MKIQFIKEDYAADYPTIAEFDVSENLTKEEEESIYDSIFQQKEEWETKIENGEDCDDEFNYWLACYNACQKVIPNKIIQKRIINTFYI